MTGGIHSGVALGIAPQVDVLREIASLRQQVHELERVVFPKLGKIEAQRNVLKVPNRDGTYSTAMVEPVGGQDPYPGLFGFETALKAMKEDFCVHRRTWEADGSGFCVFLDRTTNGHPKFSAERPGVAEEVIDMTWMPLPKDIHAEDWQLFRFSSGDPIMNPRLGRAAA